MSKKDTDRWDIDDLSEKCFEIAEKDIIGYKVENGLRAKPFSNSENNLMLDFASCGERYYDCEKRLLVLGRATGKIKDQENARMVIQYNPNNQQRPVAFKDAIRYSIEKEITMDTRWMLQYRVTPYLKLVKDCALYLNPGVSDCWPDTIAYSNLFKFIPFNGGNPSVGLNRAQKTSRVAKVLQNEIEVLQPTHILLIVGVDNDYWYPKIFQDVVNNSGVLNVKVVNRPEIRRRVVRDGIYDSIAEWKTVY